MDIKESIFDFINPATEYRVINEDSITVLRKIEDGKFDLILTSPPFNVGKSYKTKTSIEGYLRSTSSQLDKKLMLRSRLSTSIPNASKFKVAA